MNPTLDAVIQTIVKACSNIVFAVILFFVGKWAINKITKLLDGGKLIGKLLHMPSTQSLKDLH